MVKHYAISGGYSDAGRVSFNKLDAVLLALAVFCFGGIFGAAITVVMDAISGPPSSEFDLFRFCIMVLSLGFAAGMAFHGLPFQFKSITKTEIWHEY